MLVELDVRDFAIIEHIVCRLAPGFNVLTGETGAGKSIIVDAVAQLLGERSDSAMVRAGCERALLQGVFDLGGGLTRLAATLEVYGVNDGARLILSREVSAAGGSVARVNGRVVPVKALAEIGQHLVDIHGQSESASLKRSAEHVELLDRFAGVGGQRVRLADAVARLRAVESELAELRQDEASLRRRAELLAFQVEEIGEARLSEDEERALLAERARLVNAERVATLVARAYASLRDETGESPAGIDLVESGVEAVSALARIDPSLEALHAALASCADGLAEAAGDLRAYRDRMDFTPGRQEEVEERLTCIADLKRKYGGDIAAVLAYAERGAAELARATTTADRMTALEAERSERLRAIGGLAAELSMLRREAAERLARGVEIEMAALGMTGSRFEVGMERRADPDGVAIDDGCYAFDATGVDVVAFLVSTNPGEPPRPLARIASGGETARLMLALKTILTAADEVPCLIFDEIDAGIGGRVGAVVGRKLWSVAEHHQVLCVTHLPQVAAFGDTHLHVRKWVADGRTATEVVRVGGEVRVDELTSMLGSDTAAARRNAEQLLQQAELWKVTERHARGRPAV